MAKKTPTPAKPVSKPDAKQQNLAYHMEDGKDQFMTTDQGLRINDDQNTLKAGERGPSLLEDFILREKITHFDHERIPERIVHARGSAAHGVFKVYKSMAKWTKAGFLQDPGVETPVFVRFSTVAGFRGSTDLARDIRGFAVKFYTKEGNYDLVGNNAPVFFIQDAMKFPDLIHAVKPEPNNEIPQAASAHNTFWDFVSLMPESSHAVMWAMSDRAIPRSLRMMEGFGVHTFRFVNQAGKSTFVKFHWKPLLGMHSVAWDEAQKISGKDSDFHRRDLWEAIEKGAFPEWELGVQLIDEKDEHKYPFDLLDPTKLIPEEIVPVVKIGKMTLNRNPENFFAETEQVAFHPGHIVPGIDFTDDPLLQGRLFSYTDTQLSRLGSPNFHEIPINRSIVDIHNNQRDGHMRQTINKGVSSYHPNSIGGGCPYQAMIKDGGFTSYPEKVDAHKVRERSASFMDHFGQATLFFQSQSAPEQQHIINAYSFELGKLTYDTIRHRMLGILSQIDAGLASAVAANLGMVVPKTPDKPINQGVPADADKKKYEPKYVKPIIKESPALRMAGQKIATIVTRKIAFLVADGASDTDISTVKGALEKQGAEIELIAPRLGQLKTAGGKSLPIQQSFLTAASVLYDAVFIPGGEKSVSALLQEPDALHFVDEAYRHCKAIAAATDAALFIAATYAGRQKPKKDDKADPGLITQEKTSTELASKFIKAIAQHRFWDREMARKVPS